MCRRLILRIYNCSRTGAALLPRRSLASARLKCMNPMILQVVAVNSSRLRDQSQQHHK
jgi:hypothetical protein